MRNAVSEIRKTLGVDGQKASFIGVVASIGSNFTVTVIAGNREEIVKVNGIWHIGDEVVVENGFIVGLAEEVGMIVWV